MQGRRSLVSTLPENLGFDHGSTSSEATLDPQMSWNNTQPSAQNRLPDLRISPSESNIQYVQDARHDHQHPVWTVGETSSSAAHHQGDRNERKKEHIWDFHPLPEERQYAPSNIISFNNGVHSNGGQSSNAIPQDLNISPAFRDQEQDDCQLVEHPRGFTSVRLPNESEDVQRMSRKRKAIEVHGVPSSSNCFQNVERSLWHATPAPGTNTNLPETERLRLGVGGSVSASPFSLTTPGNAESSRRNIRVRFNNSLLQQNPIPENPFSTDVNVGSIDVSPSSSSRHSARLALRNRLFESTNPAPAVENGSVHGPPPPSLVPPSVRRNHHSRWSGPSSTRSSGSSSAAVNIPVERSSSIYQRIPSWAIPRNISEHPMFTPASTETGSSSQNPPLNWGTWGTGIPQNVASTSRANSSSSTSWSQRNCPDHHQRLTEIVRRSLISESGGQRSNHTVRPRSSAANPQEPSPPSLPNNNNHAHRGSHSRSALLERHYEGLFGIPYSLRNSAAASEGRSSIMSEQIRHVLDLMRRGEALRLEDMMILDHSVLFGMADMHDRHRDMRLDVDNMSYEELLALEERIGNVCTGLNEESIMTRLKQRKYADTKSKDEGETEPCSICREEYNEGEDVGILECGHEFHRECVKQWLMQKNLCPICKTAALNT